MNYPEKHREMGVENQPGRFIIPMRSGNMRYWLVCIAADGMGWEHVSISVKKYNYEEMGRCPTWEEMCFIKDLFWEKHECVVQFHPPESEYVNNHPHCLHLWKSLTEVHKTPPKSLV